MAENTQLLADYPYLRAALLLAAVLAAAKLAQWLLTGVVPRLTRRTRTEVDDRLIAWLHRPVFLTVLSLGLILLTEVLELPEAAARFTVRALLTLLVLVWLAFAWRVAHLALEILARHQERFRLVEARTLPLFDNLARIALAGGAVYLALVIWQVGGVIAGWLGAAGILGIALGFAAKDTLANLFAGIFILADAPYKVGDFIVLDSGERGRVTQVGIRSTRLLTRDDVEITLPNAVIANAKIINESGGPWEKERVRVKVGVAYGSDVDRVREVLLEVARSHPQVCADPEPRVRFRAFGDSGLAFELLCWIDQPVLRGRVLDALNTAVYKRFTAEGIEIPYPKQDVYIKEMPGGEGR